MPPPSLRGMRISGQIAVFLVFHATWALKLDVPPDVIPGETIQVSWTPAADDPFTMDLFLSCDGGFSYQMVASSVSTASASYTVIVPTLDGLDAPSPGVQLNTGRRHTDLNLRSSCIVQARKTDDVTVLDKIIIDVSKPVTASSEPTLASSEASLVSIALVDLLSSSPSPSAPITSSSLESTPTPGSITMNNAAEVPPSSQSFPIETFTSRPAQSSSTLSKSSTDISTTSITSTSSTTSVLPSSSSPSFLPSVLPSASSPTQAPTKPIATIFGAIIGGLVGLLILALLMLLLYRRRYRRRPWSHGSSLMRDVKANLSSVPISEDKGEALLANEEETPYNASKSSDPEHLGSSSHSHYHLNGDESPYNLGIQLQPMRFSESSSSILVPVFRATDVEEEEGEVQHTNHYRRPTIDSWTSSTQEGDGVSHEAGRSWHFSSRPTGYDRISQSSNDSFDIDKMDPETREQRRDALLERMRRVLDGEQSV